MDTRHEVGPDGQGHLRPQGWGDRRGVAGAAAEQLVRAGSLRDPGLLSTGSGTVEGIGYHSPL